MATNDLPQELPKVKWDDLPQLNSATSVLNHVLSYLNKDHEHAGEIRAALIILVNQFDQWKRAIFERDLTFDEIESMMMSEVFALELTNTWYQQSKAILEPVMIQSKSNLAHIRMLRVVVCDNEADREQLEKMKQLIFSKVWDFIPWFVFVATGDVARMTGCKLSLTRATF